MDSFRKDLGKLINRNSMENVSNTPDFILAGYLSACLSAFDTAVQQRETWYGRDARPGLSQEDVGNGNIKGYGFKKFKDRSEVPHD